MVAQIIQLVVLMDIQYVIHLVAGGAMVQEPMRAGDGIKHRVIHMYVILGQVVVMLVVV